MNGLLTQLGATQQGATRAVLTDPVVELAALCPICALAALSPQAALSALSPTLTMFNPAINPAAALLAFWSSPRGRAAAQICGANSNSSRLVGALLVRAGLQLVLRNGLR